MKPATRAIVSALLIRKRGVEIEVFLQTRWKPAHSPAYSGLIEIPAGGIDAYENVYDALRREVKEECGLEVTKIIDDYQSPVREPRPHDKALVFKPFVCQQVLETNNGLPWVGFVFLCEVTGEAKVNIAEAKDPRWVSIAELRAMLENHAEHFFPLQLPVLEYFVSHIENYSL